MCTHIYLFISEAYTGVYCDISEVRLVHALYMCPSKLIADGNGNGNRNWNGNGNRFARWINARARAWERERDSDWGK